MVPDPFPPARLPTAGDYLEINYWAVLLNKDRATILRMLRRQQLPPPDLVLSRNQKMWKRATIEHWLENKGNA